MNLTLNINCDLGEGLANDAELMPLIQSCNIACGGHFGDETSIKETILLAKKHGVKVGAHPSFPDPENFGRVPLNIPADELEKSLINQLTLFMKVAHEENVAMHHVKLHGALYNSVCHNKELAKTVLFALKKAGTYFKVYAPPKSEFAKLASADYEVTPEAFIDRTYQDNLQLTPRSFPNALILEPELAYQQLRRMTNKNEVISTNGNVISIKAQTFCIHGDSANALKTLRYIHKKNVHA